MRSVASRLLGRHLTSGPGRPFSTAFSCFKNIAVPAATINGINRGVGSVNRCGSGLLTPTFTTPSSFLQRHVQNTFGCAAQVQSRCMVNLPRALMGTKQRSVDIGKIRLKERSARMQLWKWRWKKRGRTLSVAKRRIKLTRFGWQHLRARSAIVDFRSKNGRQRRRTNLVELRKNSQTKFSDASGDAWQNNALITTQQKSFFCSKFRNILQSSPKILILS